MSADTLPISPARFAEAIKDLPISTLHLKVLELRNSIAHLDYSNEQLRPFALGVQAPLSGSGSSGDTPTTTAAEQQQQPDQDCVDAIAENEAVIERMQQRIRLVRAEVEGRGVGWTEFQSKEEAAAEEEERQQAREGGAAAAALANGNGTTPAANGEREAGAPAGNPWADGTFQTGSIRNGQVHLDPVAGAGSAGSAAGARPGGGSLSDEELRRRMEEQMRNLATDDDDDDDEGMHL